MSFFRKPNPTGYLPNPGRAPDGVLVRHRMRITDEIVRTMKNCRVIVRAGVGFDNVDVDACRFSGIPVCNVPNYGTTDVADHALALFLALAKGVGAL